MSWPIFILSRHINSAVFLPSSLFFSLLATLQASTENSPFLQSQFSVSVTVPCAHWPWKPEVSRPGELGDPSDGSQLCSTVTVQYSTANRYWLIAAVSFAAVRGGTAPYCRLRCTRSLLWLLSAMGHIRPGGLGRPRMLATSHLSLWRTAFSAKRNPHSQRCVTTEHGLVSAFG